MGKSSTRQKSSTIKKNTLDAASQRQRSNLKDVDVNCVQYHSGSEEETASNLEVQNTKGRHTDSEDGEDSEPELILGNTVDNESDVELSIEFFDPTPADVFPIQQFLNKYERLLPTDDTAISAKKMAEAICSQTRVGSTIRVSDDETPIGFISCLSLSDHQKLLKPITAHVLRLCAASSKSEAFEKVLKAACTDPGRTKKSRVGLLLCERVLNFPPLVVPKLLEAVFSEIEWAVEDEPTEKQRASFRFEWFLYITDVYCVNETKIFDSESADKPKAKKRRRADGPANEQIAFSRVEDEAWNKFASTSVTWNSPNEFGDKGDINRRYIAMLISAEKVGAVREMVSQLVGFNENHDGELNTGQHGSNGGE